MTPWSAFLIRYTGGRGEGEEGGGVIEERRGHELGGKSGGGEGTGGEWSAYLLKCCAQRRPGRRREGDWVD